MRRSPSLTLLALGTLLLVPACKERQTVPSSSTAAPRAPQAAPQKAAEAEDATTLVKVWFLDEERMATGKEPPFVPVERRVPAQDAPRHALEALFAGPTESERARGLRFVDSKATGFTDLAIRDGTAHVRLTGGCSSGGSTVTVANEIGHTLQQFPEVQQVKVYDPEGKTEDPDGPHGSIPFCLEP